ncbi:hypothetical protein G7046_g6193 [Stylonectria norvegica]|nr:hypothetical protein G7046_g6193 [Stylonectria norvegica]
MTRSKGPSDADSRRQMNEESRQAILRFIARQKDKKQKEAHQQSNDISDASSMPTSSSQTNQAPPLLQPVPPFRNSEATGQDDNSSRSRDSAIAKGRQPDATVPKQRQNLRPRHHDATNTRDIPAQKERDAPSSHSTTSTSKSASSSQPGHHGPSGSGQSSQPRSSDGFVPAKSGKSTNKTSSSSRSGSHRSSQPGSASERPPNRRPNTTSVASTVLRLIEVFVSIWKLGIITSVLGLMLFMVFLGINSLSYISQTFPTAINTSLTVTHQALDICVQQPMPSQINPCSYLKQVIPIAVDNGETEHHQEGNPKSTIVANFGMYSRILHQYAISIRAVMGDFLELGPIPFESIDDVDLLIGRVSASLYRDMRLMESMRKLCKEDPIPDTSDSDNSWTPICVFWRPHCTLTKTQRRISLIEKNLSRMGRHLHADMKLLESEPLQLLQRTVCGWPGPLQEAHEVLQKEISSAVAILERSWFASFFRVHWISAQERQIKKEPLLKDLVRMSKLKKALRQGDLGYVLEKGGWANVNEELNGIFASYGNVLAHAYGI